MTARADGIQYAMQNAPGVTFGVPDGFYGHRPIYYTDGPEEQRRAATRAWLKDGEGFSGTRASFATWSITATRPSTPPWDVPDPWLLPAVTTGYSNPDDIVSSWGYDDGRAGGGLVWWDVHRAGYLTPNGVNANAAVPPAWALASSPYTLANFRPGTGASATTTTTTGAGGAPATTTTTPTTTPKGPAGNPITGKATDRFLVNGVFYDGLGNAVGTTTVPATVIHDDAQSSALLYAGLAAAGLWFYSRRKRR